MTESVKLLDGKLTVFRRPASRFWWGGFYHKRTHHRVSTNCDDLEKAKQTATIWFYQKQAEFSLGIAPAVRQKTFSLAAEKAMETYSKSPRSKLYVTGLKKILNKSVLPFMDRIALEDVNQSIWHKYKEYVADRSLSRATLHQHKMAIRVVLVEAYKRGELKSIPDFKDDVVTSKVATPRTWFEPEEYKRLIQGAKDNIEKLKDTRWRDDAQEMLDYVEFIANTGMRVGEARNVRFCDVETIEDKNVSTDMDSPGWYLLIRNIKGKRGTGECKSNFEAFDTFMRIWDRRLSGEVDWRTSTEPLFKAYHRDMFRELLNTLNLRHTNDRPPRKRDLMSLRSTYICHRILAGVLVFDIAANCRTSVTMIDDHYARWLRPRSLNVNIYVP